MCSKVFDLKLIRDDSRRIQIASIKLGHERIYSTFGRLSERLLQNHPILLSKLKDRKTGLSFETKKTVTIVLGPELAQHYVNGSHLEYLGQRLLSVAEVKRKENSFAKRIRGLTFNPKADNINRFLNDFRDIVQDQDDTLVRTYLRGKLPIADFPDLKEHFGKPIDELYGELVKFYAGKFDRERAALNDLKLSEATSLEDFLAKKFRLFESYLPGVSVPERISSILSQLPEEIFAEFIDNKDRKIPKIYRTHKDSFINYLLFVAKHSRCLGSLPLTESERLRVSMTEMPHPQHLPQRSPQPPQPLDVSFTESTGAGNQESVLPRNPVDQSRSREFSIQIDDDEEEGAIPINYPAKMRLDLYQQVLDRSSN